MKQPFDGATHVTLNAEGKVAEYYKVTHWKKDGDHPDVVRYPIERREYKGLLVKDGKHKFALRFGDYIVENAKGRVALYSTLPANYIPLEKAPSLAAQLVAVMFAAIIALLAPEGSQPFVFIGVTHLMYYSALLGQWNGLTNGVFDLDTDTVRLSAHTNTYSINQDTHDFFDDVTNEVTGTNYTAGGEALASKTVTRSTNTVTFDAADVVWLQSGAGFSNARKFVLRRVQGTAATDRLYSVVTADADVGNVTGDLTVSWNASGIATWSTT